MRDALLYAAFFATACSTAYQPLGFTGGYSSTQLAPTVFTVRFKGNGSTSRGQTQDFALLRAAELCEQHGWAYFAPGGADTATDTRVAVLQNQGSTSVVTANRHESEITVTCLADPKDDHAYSVAYTQDSLRSKYGM